MAWTGARRLAAAGLLVVLAQWPAQALALQGFGISPTSQNLSLSPGGQTSGQLTVINDGDTSVNYEIYATDYRVSGEDYQGDFTNTGKGPALSAVSWFGLPKGTFTIAPRKESSFNYKIRVPKDAAIGGHYAAVFVQTIPPAASGTHISRIERIGSIFYLAVGGNLNKSGSFGSLSVPLVQWSSPVRDTFKITNNGNVHFLTQAMAELFSPFGKTGRTESTQGEVLPGTTRLFKLAVETTSPIGLYRLQTSVSYLGRTKTVSGWLLLIPKLTALITLISVALVIAGIVVWLRNRRRRLNKR